MSEDVTMTAREYLQQARGMMARLEAMNERRQRYEDLATSATAHYRSGPGGTRRVSNVEEYAVKMADLSAEMNIRAGIYAEALREIEAAIEAVPNQIYRDVLRLRYLNAWSWNRIARATHYADSYLYQVHRCAVKALNVPPDAVPVEERVKAALKERRQS